MGLALIPGQDTPTLIIGWINPGIIASKDLEEGEMRPQKHDRVIEVNGERNNKQQMIRRLAAKQVLLKVCRYNLPS